MSETDRPRPRGHRPAPVAPSDTTAPLDTPPFDAAPFDAVPFDAVVLAGGASRRLGGTDKAAVAVGGRTLLDRVLTACASARTTVVVGPERPTRHPVTFVREQPPGGGPLAALGAGLERVRQPVVLLLATDLPFLTPALVRSLATPPPGADGVIVTDDGGRDQPLTAGYRTASLRRALAGLRAAHGGFQGLPLRLLLPEMTLRRVPVAGPLDCDTWADIAAARARISDDGRVLDEWLAAVKAELDIDPEVDTTALLDAARDAAHGVTRPAAPLTTFLLGYAAARHGIGQGEAAARIAGLAARWSQEQDPERSPGAGDPGRTPDARSAAPDATRTPDAGPTPDAGHAPDAPAPGTSGTPRSAEATHDPQDPEEPQHPQAARQREGSTP